MSLSSSENSQISFFNIFSHSLASTFMRNRPPRVFMAKDATPSSRVVTMILLPSAADLRGRFSASQSSYFLFQTSSRTRRNFLP
ncbi:hypothetical protein QQP08_005187 [Theobroma cacao]|nr:hypothetical protein QQP08_005187 [Theobroma cacao]